MSPGQNIDAGGNVAGASDRPDGRFQASERRFRRYMGIMCGLGAAAVLLGLVSLVVHLVVKPPESPYGMEFSTSGEACHGNEDETLFIDESTGEVLHCVPGGFLPPRGPRAGLEGPVGAYSAEEVARVVMRARPLAAEGGLSDDDRRDVERVVEEIEREHGYGTTPLTLTQRLAWPIARDSLSLGAALVLLGGAGLWGSHSSWGKL